MTARRPLAEAAERVGGNDIVVIASRHTVATLFLETLSPTSWLEVLADERGLETAVLNPYEVLSTREAADGATYRSVLLDDLRVLQDQLECVAADE